MHLKPPPSLPTSLKWRSETHQRHLISQISSLLLQKSDALPLLKSNNPHLRLPSPLPSSLLLRILTRTCSQPETSLLFFAFAQTHLNFKPDIHSIPKLMLLLPEPTSLQILQPVLKSQPANTLLESISRATTHCKESRTRILSFVLESYSSLGLIPSALETLKRMYLNGNVPSIRSCNSLLDVLCSSKRFKVAWVCYSVLIRVGLELNEETWGVVFRGFCRQGKLENAEKLLGLGVCGVSCYDLIVDCYCRRGEFGNAAQVLKQIYERGLVPGISAYAAFLDGGLRFGDVGVVSVMLKEMIVRGLVETVLFLDYDWVVSKFCELEKSFVAEMFFERAQNVKFKFGKGVYGSFLRVLAKEGRVERGMEVYRIMLREGIAMDRSCIDVFFSAICMGQPSEEVDIVLKDSIGRGYVPTVSDLSAYIAAQCGKGQWNEASGILNMVLEKGILLDNFCCSSLVRHYCTNGLVNSAIMLHEKMKKVGSCLDEASYNVLLKSLFVERRVEEAMQVFDYMREKIKLSSASFVVMVRSLCAEREMRKAMNLHDEMLKMGLKPDDVTYKRLIIGFA